MVRQASQLIARKQFIVTIGIPFKQVAAGIALLGVLAAAWVLAGSSEASRGPVARNLVLIVVDTLRQDRLSAYGYSRQSSPNLDSLAATGVRVDGLAPSSWTKPSTATILTGLHPLRHQAIGESDVLPEEVRTLAERLSASGFDTLGVVTNGWVSRAWGFDRGFREYLYLPKMGFGRFPKSADVNSVLLPRLQGLEPPFFLYIHYLDPHMPYDPPTLWDGSALPPDLASLVPFTRETIAAMGPANPPYELIAKASELYDGEVRANDRAIGEVLDALEELGLTSTTLVVVTSDHGEEFLEHGRVGHGKALYEESVRVPLIFSAPCCIPGGESLGTTGLEDVAPTVLDLLGIRSEGSEGPGFDGVSIAPSLRRPRSAVVRTPDLLLHLDLESEGTASVALRKGDQKLLLGKKPYAKSLFDLKQDPSESEGSIVDLSAPGRTAVLANELALRYNDLSRRALRRRSTTAESELVAEIRALGYLNTFSERSGRRLLPRRLRPADPRPGGFLGWEDLSSPRSCFTMDEAPAGQLLEGWFAFEEGREARWTAPFASIALPSESVGAESTLELDGINYRTEPHKLTVSWWHGSPVETQIAKGPFRIRLRLQRGATGFDGFDLLELRSTPPFRPRDSGQPDDRILGVVLTRVCLDSEGSAGEKPQRR